MNGLLTESLSNNEPRYISNSIRSSAAQLLTVINDVLDLSKIEAGHLDIESVPFRICQLVDNTHSIIAIQAELKGFSFTGLTIFGLQRDTTQSFATIIY